MDADVFAIKDTAIEAVSFCSEQKIPAIKKYRELYQEKFGYIPPLHESKEAVDAVWEDRPRMLERADIAILFPTVRITHVDGNILGMYEYRGGKPHFVGLIQPMATRFVEGVKTFTADYKGTQHLFHSLLACVTWLYSQN